MPDDRDQFKNCQPFEPNSIHKRLLDELFDAVYFVDRTRRIQYWNRAAEAMSGFREKDVLGRHCYDNLLCHTNDSGKILCHEACPLQRCMEARERRKADVYLRHKDGHRLSVSVRVSPITNDKGEVIGAVESFLDNSSKKNLQRRTDELNRIAYMDSLTGLVNRRYLEMRLGQADEEFALFKSPFGILMIDVDHFKKINDSFGHAGGDMVLANVAQVLGTNLLATDTIGRWGGEEFVAILPHADASMTRTLADRCRMLIESSAVTIGTKRVSATVSIGATTWEPNDTPSAVLARADAAMYQSKTYGRNLVTMATRSSELCDRDLSRGPLEIASTEQVQVEMKDRLT